MNRFLVITSGALLLLSIMMASVLLLGYSAYNVIAVVFNIFAFASVGLVLLTMLLAVVADILISLLMFYVRTWGRQSNRMRLFTRRMLHAFRDPPDWFFLLLTIVTTTGAIRLTAILLPKYLHSPELLADVVISSIFWLVFLAMTAFAESWQ